MAAPDGAPAELKLFVREKEGLSLLRASLDGTTVSADAGLHRVAATSGVVSPDGRLLAIVSGDHVRVVSTSDGATVLDLPLPGVSVAAFSPRGTLLHTFQKSTGAGPNLVLRPAAGGEPVLQLAQKAMSKTNWPSIQMSEDESVACRVVTSEVHFYDGRNLPGGVVEKLRVQGLAAAQLAPNPPTHAAVFVPEIKGAPASVRIYPRGAGPDAAALARRSFYKASSVRMVWNRGTTAVLVLVQSDVDKSNQSYYGEATLHFLACDGSFEGTVPLSKEGPIHDVQWSPTGADFVVVYGFMPAKATLFNSKCKPLFDFGSGPKNCIRWNPHGRYILLAGYGNLPGDMEFWDRKELKLVGSTKAPCTVTAEWAPSGRVLLAATTAPRLQVDNGIKIFKYDGTLLYAQPYPLLFQAEWCLLGADAFPDRPPSPKSRPSADGANGKAPPVAAAGPPPKAAPYRPPNAPSGAGSALRAQLLGENDPAKRLDGGGHGSSGAGESKSAAKNRKRREKEKEKREAEAAGGPAAASDAVEEMGDKLEHLAPPSSEAGSDASIGGGDVAKKLRALNKKLRQLEELKKKAEEQGGAAALPEPQREKLAQEAALRQEILELEGQL